MCAQLEEKEKDDKAKAAYLAAGRKVCRIRLGPRASVASGGACVHRCWLA